MHVTSSTGTAVLLAKVSDVSAGGSATLPGGQVSPVRLTGLPADGRDVTVTLPALAHVFPAGHRVRVSLSSTDLAYAGPAAPATYTARLDPETALTLPLVPVHGGGGGLLSLALVSALIASGLALVIVVVVLRRRRDQTHQVGSEDATPVVIRGLAKSYADGFRAVDGVDLTANRDRCSGCSDPTVRARQPPFGCSPGSSRPARAKYCCSANRSGQARRCSAGSGCSSKARACSRT